MSNDYYVYENNIASYNDLLNAENLTVTLYHCTHGCVAVCKKCLDFFYLIYSNGFVQKIFFDDNKKLSETIVKVKSKVSKECSLREFKCISSEEIIQFLKGEIKIETRHGIEVKQLVILKKPYCQGNNNVMQVVLKDGTYVRLYKSGKFDLSANSNFDLFIKK